MYFSLIDLKTPIVLDLRGEAEFKELKGLVNHFVFLKRKHGDSRHNAELMLRVDGYISSMLHRLTLDFNEYKLIQFPANIRILNTDYFFNMDAKASPYDTRFVHCDYWSGAPSDTINFFVYLSVNKNSSWLRLWEGFGDIDAAIDYRGSYSSAPDFLKLREVEFPKEEGFAVLFPTMIPHQTIEGSGARISLDVRLKRSPHRVGENLFEDGQSLTTSNGVYWPTSSGGFKTVQERLDLERLLYPHLAVERQNYIARFKQFFHLEEPNKCD
jgi:hypothetical protein